MGILWHAPVLISLALTLTAEISANMDTDSYYSKFNKPHEMHTMVKYKGFGEACGIGGNKVVARSGPVKDDEIKQFLKVHNDYRRKVAKGLEMRGAPGPQPQAANMKELTWDRELATIAQRWAEQCPGKGNTPHHDKNRRNDRYKAVGQNMFSDTVSSIPTFGMPNPPLSANPSAKTATKLFYLEVAKPGFDRSHIDPFQFVSGTGHYTQLVWADTEKIGCGFFMLKKKKPRGFYSVYKWQRFLICNYGPAGNILGQRIYKIGPSGSQCPKGTVNNDGLCSQTGGQSYSGQTGAESYSGYTEVKQFPAQPLPVPTTESPAGCPHPDRQFLCRSGDCIGMDWVCDGFSDCPDDDDETDCWH